MKTFKKYWYIALIVLCILILTGVFFIISNKKIHVNSESEYTQQEQEVIKKFGVDGLKIIYSLGVKEINSVEDYYSDLKVKVDNQKELELRGYSNQIKEIVDTKTHNHYYTSDKENMDTYNYITGEIKEEHTYDTFEKNAVACIKKLQSKEGNVEVNKVIYSIDYYDKIVMYKYMIEYKKNNKKDKAVLGTLTTLLKDGITGLEPTYIGKESDNEESIKSNIDKIYKNGIVIDLNKIKGKY